VVRIADRRIVSTALIAGTLILVAALVRPAVQRAGFAAPQDGLERLKRKMGGFTPDGRDVTVLQVEASGKEGWSLDPAAPAYRGIVIDPVAPGATPGSHAAMVANAMLSLSPRLAKICTASSDWFLNELLQVGRPVSPRPLPSGAKIAFCAWVASVAGDAGNDVLRRADWLIVNSPFLLVAGQSGSASLMAAGYNSIAVGSANGVPNVGTPAGIDGPGRCKPEIVTGESAASPATGRVAGAAAMLFDAAVRLPKLRDDPDAQRPEVVKAILLAGAARRSEWTNLAPDASAPAVRAANRPLDRAVGAGTLDVARAVGVLLAGRPQPDSAMGIAGWDLVRWKAPSDHGVAEASTFLRLERDAGELAIVCCWNRMVLDGSQWRLADVDLRIERIGDEDSAIPWASSGNDVSESRIDNVEMILLRDIRAGEYRVTVHLRQGDPVPVAMAWLVSGPSRAASPTEPPAR
jgi:hypothetical protein